MPFTLSHPAAVLSLLRRPFVPVALIAGAMVPDLPYFLDVPVTAQSWYEPFVNATFSHSLQGLLLVGLPSVVLVTLLFQLVRGPVGDLLPLRLHVNGRDGAEPRSPFSFCIWFLISALAGMATHVVWDSLTEGGSWVVTQLPFLDADLDAGHAIDRVLQHGSTLLGAVLIVVWCVRSFRSRGMSIERVTVSGSWVLQRVGTGVAIIVVSAAFAVLAVKQAQDLEGSVGLELALSLFLKSGIRTAVMAVVIYALTWHAVRLFRKLTSHSTDVQGHHP